MSKPTSHHVWPVQCVNLLRPSPPYMGKWLGSSLVRVIAVSLFGARPLPKPVKKYCQLDPKWLTSVNFQSNHNVIFIQGNALNRKCLHGHFVPAWMCYLFWTNCPISLWTKTEGIPIPFCDDANVDFYHWVKIKYYASDGLCFVFVFHMVHRGGLIHNSSLKVRVLLQYKNRPSRQRDSPL